MKLNIKEKLRIRMNLETFYSVYIFTQFFLTLLVLISIVFLENT